MGTCLSKKKESSTSTKSTTTTSVEFEWKNNSSCKNGITVSKPEVKTQQEVKLKNENNKKHVDSVQEHRGQVKKEIFIIKHRKSHDDKDRNSSIEGSELMGMRTSSCTKEDVDAILIHCGRLSRNSSGKASSFREQRRRFSSSKRSNDFDNCDNDAICYEKDQKISGFYEDGDWKEPAEKFYQHLQSPRSLSMDRNRRRTPSREREQQQCSSSRERRISISPVRRCTDTTTTLNARNNTNTSSMPAKMVSVPATVTSLVMDKSYNNGCGGGESAAATARIRRITVRRNVGSPRSQSPARANGNAVNQQQELSFSRNSSRKKEESPYRRNPLSELESNYLAIPHSTANSNSSWVQNRSKKEVETEDNQKPNASRSALDKCVDVNCKTKLQQDEDVKVKSSMIDNVVVKTMGPQVVENLKPHTLTRTRSSRRSRDLELDLSPEALSIPPQSYTSLLLEDIQNFHQKNTPSPPSPPVSLPACVARACSILEAVANLNSNTSSNLSGVGERRNPLGFQSSRNEYNVPLGTSNSYGKSVADTKAPIVESELIVYDDMVESSLHKFETMDKGGSNMEEQESSGSNSLTVSSAKLRRGISSSCEPSSTDSKDCWTVRTNNGREDGQKIPLGLEARVSPVARRANVDGAKRKLNSKKRVCDRQHDNETGRGRLGANNVLHMKPVVTAAAST
ncbi:uncharacterized protein At1g65710-like [Trifolium pratense]|uniref:uncharacterized protein At1g65710-like n=1 Tax=Trifolium pratense TaxID=57577 RepID=UPI001E697379|nr:uncharacterized protein At1g65710-like [Trifolium pratense]